jgi:hypothetical protein
MEAFKHCCDVLSIDGMFLTGKYEGTMLIGGPSTGASSFCHRGEGE